ncbi:MAG: hypothetical protein NTW20_07150 [Rhodobacterales bacterium]|nr:hypothetical protein [Rhodobacterales bacterium]
MSALRSDPPVQILALRVALGFAASLTIAEGWDLEFSFVAALVGATLTMGPAISMLGLVVLPPLAWVMATVSVLLVEAFAKSVPPVFLLVTVGCLWLGFRLSARPDRMNVIGLLILVLSCVIPLRLLAYPEVTDMVVHDLVSNVLVGVGVAFALGLVLAGPEAPPVPAPRYEVLPALTAAIVLTLGAFLVWVFEPPAPGAVLIGAIITLRADLHPGYRVARDRIIGALVGGGLAVVAATVMGLAPVLPTLFLVLMVVSWPLALRIVQDGPWQGAAIKSLYAVGILVGEGFSPLFEDTGERLGIRIVGVFIGLLFAMAAIALLARRNPVVPQPGV